MNETESDVVTVKAEPKVSVEKAQAALASKVQTLITEAVQGFELDDSDKKSRKSIIRAVGFAVSKALHGQAGLHSESIGRNLRRGVFNASPVPAIQPVSELFNEEEDAAEEDGDLIDNVD